METPETIEFRVKALAALESCDRDAAACGADMLRVDVLQAIADGADDPQALALAALETVAMDIGGR